MVNQSKTINVYVGECKEKDYVFALTPESAVALVKTHYAFGDPSDSEYAVSDVWAASSSEDGWRIRQIEVEAFPIAVEVASTDGTHHVNWTCPFCHTAYSDDWLDGESLPILLTCGCTDDPKFLLGDVLT